MGLACFKPPNLVDVRSHRCRTLNRLNPQPQQSTLGFWKAVDLEASAWRFLFWDYHLRGLFSGGQLLEAGDMMSKAQAVTLKLSLMSRDCLAPWMTAIKRAVVCSSGDASLRLGREYWQTTISHEIFETAKFYCKLCPFVCHVPTHSTLVPQKTSGCCPSHGCRLVFLRRILGLAPTLLRFVAWARTVLRVVTMYGPSIPNCWDINWDMGFFLGCEATWVHCFLWYIWKNIISLFYGNSCS